MKSMMHLALAILALGLTVAVSTGETWADDKAKSNAYDKHIADMKDAFRKAQHGRALKSCKKAYALEPSQELGAQCGVAACRAKKIREATRFYKKSDKKRKRILRKFCLAEGIDLSE